MVLVGAESMRLKPPSHFFHGFLREGAAMHWRKSGILAILKLQKWRIERESHEIGI
jgi:hypothetical protein